MTQNDLFTLKSPGRSEFGQTQKKCESFQNVVGSVFAFRGILDKNCWFKYQKNRLRRFGSINYDQEFVEIGVIGTKLKLTCYCCKGPNPKGFGCHRQPNPRKFTDSKGGGFVPKNCHFERKQANFLPTSQGNTKFSRFTFKTWIFFKLWKRNKFKQFFGAVEVKLVLSGWGRSHFESASGTSPVHGRFIQI